MHTATPAEPSPRTDIVVYQPSQINLPVSYQPSQIKRFRSTKAQVTNRRHQLLEIVAAQRPMTVRQVFYQATVRGLVEKEESGYQKVQTDLVLLRRSGELPYSWIADNTRYTIQPTTYFGIGHALRATSDLYRKDLWADADCHVEIWIEKDALASVISSVTDEYGVPVMVARGFSSTTFLHNAAMSLAAKGKPAFVYHLGDFDPSGRCAAEKIEAGLRHHAPDSEIHFECLAVNMDQIRKWNLATRQTKRTDTRAKGFGDISCELDAVDPETLRSLVLVAIDRHMPSDVLADLQEEEETERRALRRIVDVALRGGFSA